MNLAITLNPNASPFHPLAQLNKKEVAFNRLKSWGFSAKFEEMVEAVIDEWYKAGTLNGLLNQWELYAQTDFSSKQIPLHVLCYNVQGWGTRALEAIDLVFQTDASICVFTETGQLWNTSRMPHFNTFHQKGTNKSGGVCVAVGKHLKANQIDCDIENTVVVDIYGLTVSMRIIGIYWPQEQKRNLQMINPFLIENTIITGDFNAAMQEWGSPSSDKRGKTLKEWIEKNTLAFIPSTAHSSKRSLRHIDLTFSNLEGLNSETMLVGTSDHWPILLTCVNADFDTSNMFPHVQWLLFQAVLALLQEFWVDEQERRDSHDRPEKAFWNYLSRVYKPKTLPFFKLAVNGKSLSDEQEITDELYKYYEEQFQPPSIDKNDPHDAEIDKEYIEMKKVLETSNEPVRATSIFEITKYIKKLKGKKSAGYDSVSNYMLKLLPPGYVDCLTKCFNKWLTECSYPEPWKMAKIIILSTLKAGVPRCDQTRPISLLATHSKLFEKVLLERVRHWAESQQLVPIEQSGFRP
ncbi:unnamed protein product [Didymodactylos carnosus]|uniref:Endonuclease/exonuclease/phosphatase domain-containing protein n=1 Tax=Didymodactylos carnosus TaxID=1234261 RepID=A0A814TBQ2_9BILA|nr:unnamed protein product [Didymodactylos carnosus]CAF1158652.1 unnamed protein product [Didymodactylos carnosus]CAF3765419.1 unnamed protein product [Didymodactylos carnosus]CAF3922042.1 unnamed protein product [Didymodactylos carnosus]